MLKLGKCLLRWCGPYEQCVSVVVMQLGVKTLWSLACWEGETETLKLVKHIDFLDFFFFKDLCSVFFVLLK